MKKTEVEYFGHDLDSMDLAVNYHSWILDIFRPFLGKRIIEVGAGTGSFSKLLLETKPTHLTLIEPSAMYETLKSEIDVVNGGAQTELFNGIFSDFTVADRVVENPDSIVYINVLEHVEDDVAELQVMHRTLADNGKICIFVPAVPFLLSDFDRQIGHYRRYSRSDLVRKCEKAGFRIILARGFDLPGILPWLLKYRLMRSLTIEHSMVQLYDRFFVPPIRFIEDRIKPPIGKNLILVAEKVCLKPNLQTAITPVRKLR
jgi:Methyltransferase domain.